MQAAEDSRGVTSLLQAEVAERLLDRLEDCKRTFPRVAVLGGAGEAVVSRLCGGRAGIESAVLLDSSHAMLERCRQRVSIALLDLPTANERLYSCCPSVNCEHGVNKSAFLLDFDTCNAGGIPAVHKFCHAPFHSKQWNARSMRPPSYTV